MSDDLKTLKSHLTLARTFVFLGICIPSLNDVLRPWGLHEIPFDPIFGIISLFLFAAVVFFRARIHRISFLFLGMLAISMCSGLLNGTISIFSLKSIYIFIMPIIFLSVGYYYKNLFGPEFEKLLRPAILMSLIFLILIQTLYFVHMMNGRANRIGNSNQIALVIVYLYFYLNKAFLAALPFSAIVSGKRVDFIIILMFLFYQVFISGGGRVVKWISVGVCALVTVLFADELLLYFNRWFVHFNSQTFVSISQLDLFSSGRVGQWLGALNALDSWSKLIWGAGSGAPIYYVSIDGGATRSEVSWYVHNAWLSYLVQFGVFGMSLFMFLVFKLATGAISERKKYPFSVFVFFVGLVSTIFSAFILTNPLFWFFCGFLLTIKSNDRMQAEQL